MASLLGSGLKLLIAASVMGSVGLSAYLFPNYRNPTEIVHKNGTAPVFNKNLAQAEDAFLSLQDWFPAGSNPQDYAMGADESVQRQGRASGTILAIDEDADGFGTLMQVFDAADYRGQRLRLRGYVKTDAVEDWAGLWMRVDGSAGEMLSFDNMGNRPIKGTTDWQPYDVVLDVPAESDRIAFGLLMGGTGQAWMDDLQFDVVDRSVPTTDLQTNADDGPKPSANLSFETFE